MSGAAQRVAWEPQPGPQSWAIACPYPELLMGGATGGGKTDFLLGDFSSRVDEGGRGWVGILFRRTYDELVQVERRLLEIWEPIIGTKFYNRGTHTAYFPSGAILELRYLESDMDAFHYQGRQYAWCGWDELTQWPTDWAYTWLFSRIRSPSGEPCYFRATSNPGGPGHNWVKERFMQPDGRPVAPMTPMRVTLPSGRVWTRVFIPSRLEHNLILMKNDPHYVDRIEQMSDPALKRAYLEGDWDILAGSAFPEWDKRVHVRPSHMPPPGSRIWRAMDWGYIKPYCCLWFYTNSDGNVCVFNEMYGWGGKPNVGSEEDPEVVKEKILSYESQHNIWCATSLLDPQCWDRDDRQSKYSQLGGAKLGWKPWPKGPNSRVALLQNLHSYLKVVNGRSRLTFTDNCYHSIRTIPVIPRDLKKPEDVDTRAEDHALDAVRGGLALNILTKEQRNRIEQIQVQLDRQYEAESRGTMGGW